MAKSNDNSATDHGSDDGIDAEVAARIQEVIRTYICQRDSTLNLVVRLRAGRLSEPVRRHHEGLKLKSTYNSDRVKALAALVAKLTGEVEPLLTEALIKMMELEIARLELEAYRNAEQDIIAERALRKESGMYAEPTRLVDLLYTEHGIDRGDFAALQPEDVVAIAKILRDRAAPLRTPEALDQAMKDARAF